MPPIFSILFNQFIIGDGQVLAKIIKPGFDQLSIMLALRRQHVQFNFVFIMMIDERHPLGDPAIFRQNHAEGITNFTHF